MVVRDGSDEMSDMSVKRRVGLRVRAAREAAGMTQEQLSARIGLNRSSVANIELGNQELTVSRLAIVAEVLHLDLADLVGADDLPMPPHDVRIRRVYEVTCETCGGIVLDCHTDRAVAMESKRDHIAAMREAS